MSGSDSQKSFLANDSTQAVAVDQQLSEQGNGAMVPKKSSLPTFTLVVGPMPENSTGPKAPTLNPHPHDPGTDPKGLTIQNIDTETENWQWSATIIGGGIKWLKLSSSSGPLNANQTEEVQVTAKTAMPPGTYTAHIVFVGEAGGQQSKPVTVEASLII